MARAKDAIRVRWGLVGARRMNGKGTLVARQGAVVGHCGIATSCCCVGDLQIFGTRLVCIGLRAFMTLVLQGETMYGTRRVRVLVPVRV